MGFEPFSNIPHPAYYTLQVVKANEFVKINKGIIIVLSKIYKSLL